MAAVTFHEAMKRRFKGEAKVGGPFEGEAVVKVKGGIVARGGAADGYRRKVVTVPMT